MKSALKYFLVLLLSFLSVFYNNQNLNILLLLPIVAFSMANGIKYFILSLIGIFSGGVIYFKIFNSYIYLIYSLIALSIYFFVYHLCIIFNKKIIYNFFVSILFSLLLTYFIYMFSFNIFNYKLLIYLIIISILTSFVFAFLYKNFSLYLLVYEQNTAKITVVNLLCMYISLINNILANNNVLYYISLFAILISIYIFILKNEILNSITSLSLIFLCSALYNITIINENILLIIISGFSLAFLKCKYNFLNSMLLFSNFLLIMINQNQYQRIEFFYLFISVSLAILFIKYSKNNDKIDNYYNQYLTNKEDIVYYLDNIENMFSSIATNFKNSYINGLLRKCKDEVFDTICNKCEKFSTCYKKDNHILLNYIRDYLNNSLDEKKIENINKNCIRHESYFKLLDKFTTTYLINNYKNEDKNILKDIVSTDFSSFAKVINQCKLQIKDDRLNKINMFYKNLKAELKEFKYDVLFVKNLSNESSFIFDIAIKNIKLTEIDTTVIPIVNKLLNSYMAVYKVDTSTLTFSYLIISIKEIDKLDISFAYRQSNEDVLVCGDSIMNFESDKQFYISISDGMGNGMLANEESKFTLDTLFSMIKTKMDVKTSIVTCNDLIRLKNQPETYTTLDFLAINKYSHIASFYKFGAINSFIIRDHIVNQVSNYSLPLGIIDEIYVKPSSYKLKRKDVIVMCSDGIIDDNNSNIISILENISYDDPTIICNTLFSQLLNIRKNIDDATILVITIK